MMYMITPKHFGECVDEIQEMHRLRYRVFKERLNWDVEVSGDLEIDRFDALGPTYLVHRGQDGHMQGCVRLLPTTGPTMLGETFPALLDGNPMPQDPRIWESSRFCLDTAAHPTKVARGASQGFCELCSGMIEFGLSRGLTHIVTVTDMRVERLARTAGWPFSRVGEPRRIDNIRAVAILLEVSVDALSRVRDSGDLRGPILWEPVQLEQAA
jgi:acyl homoserine lactone synthase